MATSVIRQLLSIRGLNIECPKCGGAFPVRKAKPFRMYEVPPAAQRIIESRTQAAIELEENIKEQRKLLNEARKRRPERVTVAAQASTFGQVSEQILPAFLTFPYERNECRILLKPVDYVIFRGLSSRARVDAIRFVDVKTGNGRLTAGQRQIRDRVVEGKVKHKVIGR